MATKYKKGKFLNFSARNYSRSKKLTLQLAKPKNLQVSLEATIPHPKTVVASFVLVFVTILIAVASQSYLPPEIPLYYGLPEGELQIAPSSALVIPSLVSLAINTINTTLAYFLKEKFVQRTLVFASFAVAVFSVVTTVKIIFLIGSF